MTSCREVLLVKHISHANDEIRDANDVVFAMRVIDDSPQS